MQDNNPKFSFTEGFCVAKYVLYIRKYLKDILKYKAPIKIYKASVREYLPAIFLQTGFIGIFLV